MGWVTLTLRKRELKQEHQYYQLRDLQISREKRKLARQKSYEMAVIQRSQKADENAAKGQYDYSSIMSDISNLRSQLTSETEFNKKMQPDEGTMDFNGKSYGTYSEYNKAIENQIATKQNEYQQMIVNRTDAINGIKDMYDQQKADLEQEVGDQETELEMEQVEVEAQMEAISAEMQAVSDAISSEIQSSTIKLA